MLFMIGSSVIIVVDAERRATLSGTNGGAQSEHGVSMKLPS
jgi:hypothetical protein